MLSDKIGIKVDVTDYLSSKHYKKKRSNKKKSRKNKYRLSENNIEENARKLLSNEDLVKFNKLVAIKNSDTLLTKSQLTELKNKQEGVMKMTKQLKSIEAKQNKTLENVKTDEKVFKKMYKEERTKWIKENVKSMEEIGGKSVREGLKLKNVKELLNPYDVSNFKLSRLGRGEKLAEAKKFEVKYTEKNIFGNEYTKTKEMTELEFENLVNDKVYVIIKPLIIERTVETVGKYKDYFDNMRKAIDPLYKKTSDIKVYTERIISRDYPKELSEDPDFKKFIREKSYSASRVSDLESNIKKSQIERSNETNFMKNRDFKTLVEKLKPGLWKSLRRSIRRYRDIMTIEEGSTWRSMMSKTGLFGKSVMSKRSIVDDYIKDIIETGKTGVNDEPHKNLQEKLREKISDNNYADRRSNLEQLIRAQADPVIFKVRLSQASDEVLDKVNNYLKENNISREFRGSNEVFKVNDKVVSFDEMSEKINLSKFEKELYTKRGELGIGITDKYIDHLDSLKDLSGSKDFINLNISDKILIGGKTVIEKLSKLKMNVDNRLVGEIVKENPAYEETLKKVTEMHDKSINLEIEKFRPTVTTEAKIINAANEQIFTQESINEIKMSFRQGDAVEGFRSLFYKGGKFLITKPLANIHTSSIMNWIGLGMMGGLVVGGIFSAVNSINSIKGECDNIKNLGNDITDVDKWMKKEVSVVGDLLAELESIKTEMNDQIGDIEKSIDKQHSDSKKMNTYTHYISIMTISSFIILVISKIIIARTR